MGFGDVAFYKILPKATIGKLHKEPDKGEGAVWLLL